MLRAIWAYRGFFESVLSLNNKHYLKYIKLKINLRIMIYQNVRFI
jgi:hypothetical protein